MVNYRKHFSTRETPQSEPVPGRAMARNNAGGFAFQIDKWMRLRRFLILGSEGGTYYVSEHKLTIDNARNVLACIREDGKRAVQEIVGVSESGRTPKNDPALFALAMAMSEGDLETRREAFSAFPRVARTGYHLFRFAEYVEGFRGWGRGLRRTIGRWYLGRDPDMLAYQVIKYQQREGWSHRDILRLAHPKTVSKVHNAIFRWITQGEVSDDLPDLIVGLEKARKAQNEQEIVKLIEEYGLPWEAIPTEFLGSARVWEALLPRLPMTALLRNLARMTANGLLVPMSDAVKLVTERITNEEALRKARVHPIQVLSALITYQRGRGTRGRLTWEPVARIIDALDAAFYLSFGNVEPIGKRVILALDVSASMATGMIAGVPGLTPRVAAAAMAMVTARVEPEHVIVAFTGEMVPLDISPRERLDDVLEKVDRLDFGPTDCSLPMMWALGYQPKVAKNWWSWRSAGYRKVRNEVVRADAFLIYTDSETWFGKIHPFQALQKYRHETGIDAKLVVVAMTATEFSIADPGDPGMLDVVGFDTATPSLIADFVRGEI